MTRGSGQARLEELDSMYAQASNIHSKILGMKVSPNHVYFSSKVFDAITDSYYDRKGDYKDFFYKLDENRATVVLNATQANANQSVNHDIHSFTQFLPKIDIPSFSGKYSEWENFAMIHRKEDVFNVVKFYYLRTHLEDEALPMVKNLPLMDENYPKAWDKLTEIYENERRVINLYLAELFAVKPAKSESSSELKRILRETFDPIDSLQSLGRPTDQWDDLLVFITASRFDSNTRKD